MTWVEVMQIALRTQSSAAEYIVDKEWRLARPGCCPFHPSSRCALIRHGTYVRLSPVGMRVARWYCKESRRTFSLLPDFLAARLPGLLADIENVVAAVVPGRSLESVAGDLREIELALPSAIRWLRRRLQPVRAAIASELVQGALKMIDTPMGSGLLEHLRRELEPSILSDLPAPIGWRRKTVVEHDAFGHQQRMGPDDHEAKVYRHPNTLTSTPWLLSQPTNVYHRHPRRKRSGESGVPIGASPRAVFSNTFSG